MVAVNAAIKHTAWSATKLVSNYFQFMDRGAANLSLLPTPQYIRGRDYNAICTVYPHCTTIETAL